MKAVVFSDLHGNLPALESFVKRTKGCGLYVCLGDVVNYGPWSDECLELIDTLPGLVFLEGNHERLYLGTEDVTQEHPLVQRFVEQTLPSFKRYDLITDLPESYSLEGFTFIHTINHRRIFWDTDIELDRSYCIGHTHHAFDVMRGPHRMVNCGSLGQNRRHIDRCNYAVMDLNTGSVELKEFEHDVSLILSEMKSRKYPEECIEYYRGKLPKH